MFKNMNWNVLVPTIVSGIIVSGIMWFMTKPGGLLNKADGEDEDEE